MCNPLVVVFALFTTLILHAEITDLNLWIEAHFHQSSVHGYQNHIQPYGSRILQQNGIQCDCSTLRQDIYNESRQTWFTNDSAISLSDVSIQCAMDCAEDSHMIMLSSNSTIQLESTILINKQVTISSFHYQEADPLDVTYPTSKRKTVVTCPENSIHDIFNINSGGAIVTNLEARDFMSPKNAFPAAIEECRNNIGGLKPHHVDFVSNTSSLQPVTVHTLPGSISCGALEMTDILFQGNKAGNHRVFVKIQFETIMKNIRIGNSQPKNGNEQENNFFLITIMEKHKDILTINSLAAIGYSVPIVKARFGVVNILGSVFEENKFNMEDNKIKLDASMIRFLSTSKVTIRDCSFNNNVGGGQGVIFSDNMSSIEIRNFAFSQNSKYANVIFTTELEVKTNYWDLVSNIGLLRGGVLHLKNSNAIITNSTFSDNMSDESGGAVFAVKNSNIRVLESWFVKNQARKGGYFHIEDSNFSILKSSLKENTAEVDGGAIRLERGGVICNDSDFTYNTTLDDGGALNIESATYVNWTGVRFSYNRATFGLSVHIVKCNKKVLWKDVNFQNSTVGLTGAAAYIDDSNVTIDGAFFQNLTAPYGGALYAQSFDIIIKNTLFKNNHAGVMGGAISGEIGTIIFKNTTFIENSSMLGGVLYFYNSMSNASDISFEKNTASEGAGLLLKDSNVSIGPWPWVKNNNSFLGVPQFDFLFEIDAFNNTGIDSGGVIAAKVSNVQIGFGRIRDHKAPENGDVQITSNKKKSLSISDSEFEGNVADMFGGGIRLTKPDSHLDNIKEAPSRHLFVLHTNFTKNRAGRSEGSLIRSERYGIHFFLLPEDISLLDFSETKGVSGLHSSNTSYRPRWKERVHAEKRSPVPSYVNRCQATVESKDNNWSKISDKTIEISETVPGERLPDIIVTCYDEFGDIAESEGDGFTAYLKSTDKNDLQGIFITDLEGGTGKFTGIRNPPNGDTFNGSYTYQLKISFSPDYVPPITIQMNVRECRINEEKNSEGVLCRKCDATQYNFNPMIKTCKPCDSTLECSGTFVRPRENYWHASPCHTPAQKCLTAYACRSPADIVKKLTTFDYKNISSALGNYSCKISDEARKEYQKLLCKEGYKGVLCGSCKADYGLSLSFACTKCNGAGFSMLILGAVCVWLAIIAGISIRGSTTIEERLSVIKNKLNDLAARESHTIIESLPEEVDRQDNALDTIEEENDRQIEGQGLVAGPSTERVHKRITSDLLKSTNMSLWQGCNLPTDIVDAIAESSEKINNLRLAQLAKWKLREVFKMMINFLQAIALAAVINVEWTRYMLIVFNISAFVGDASAALITRTSQCLPWWRGTKYATYIGLVSGILIPIFVILYMVAFFAFQTYKSSKGMHYFVKRSVFAALAICYFSYLNITKVAVMFFYCVAVRTNEDHFSTDETYYWALDTSIQCSASYHKKFMVFGGILFALFSVGFPLISAAVLVLFRKDSGHDDPQWMSDILGFLHRAYKRKFIYWESIVMLRKALLSVITIFSYHLGGHTQSLLASYILSACLFLQAICRPYRHEFESLNIQESLSLLISSTTFTLALFFTNDKTDPSFKLFLNLSLLFAIVGFLLFMTISMLICLLDVWKTNLKVTRGLSDDNKNFWSAVSTWISYKIGFIERSSNNDDDNDIELGSIKSKKLTIDNDMARYGP